MQKFHFNILSDENESLSLLNEELGKENENNINNFNFNIKSLNPQLLDKFINKQDELVNQTKLKIDSLGFRHNKVVTSSFQDINYDSLSQEVR